LSEAKDPKARFREALEKKNSTVKLSNESKGGKSKVQGAQSSGGAPKIFRRKSGSS